MNRQSDRKLRQDLRKLYLECCRQLGKPPMRMSDFEDAMRRETEACTDDDGTIDGADLAGAPWCVIALGLVVCQIWGWAREEEIEEAVVED